MINRRALQWIEEGYKMVSKNGFKSLNIESIGRNIQKNKSSFYHYFGDMETFESELFEHHYRQADLFSRKIVECEVMKPDMLNLFIGYKIDLFFHRQLRINRDNPIYKNCFEKSFKIIETSLIHKWVDFLELKDNIMFATSFLNIIIDNFFLRITDQTFDYQWLSQYLDEIITVLNQMGIIADNENY